MTFETYPSAAPTPQSTPPKKSNVNWRTAIMVALVIALLATWGYIIWDKSKNKEIFAQKDAKYATAVSEKDTLQLLLNEATDRYDELNTISIKKDSTITARDKEIAAKKQAIQKLLATANGDKTKLAEARKMIESLNSDIEDYKSQIEVLKGEKIQLTREKEMITQEKNKLSSDLDSTKGVVQEKENIIDIGSTLHASHFSVIGINEKKSGKEKETSTAKRVDKFRITFDIDENRITKSGNKDIFVCITTPDGKTVTEDGLGSGSFIDREGNEIKYTKRIAINYIQGQRQSLSFDWKAGDYTTGDYKIVVYNNGFKIGEGVHHLKKGGLFS
ncbi:hypothetical protein ACQ33O_11240 [Ferruginibacter sp. SUN002]|uniref:hypothetical protein n=1 Tax=Ferruginibacter sp. SUN002 TaxID=2937789 RepID=UPI003D35DD25